MSRTRIEAGDGDSRHGTDNGYSHLKCRCEQCTAARAAYKTNVLKPKRVAKGIPDGDPRHGTEYGYCDYGCRCRSCTDAWAKAAASRRRRRRARSQ
jgi:hypothetical protein